MIHVVVGRTEGKQKASKREISFSFTLWST